MRKSTGFNCKNGDSRRRIRRPELVRAALFVAGALERRVLLTANVWNNPNGGDWDTASNWSLGHVPLATEDAVIPNLTGTAYVVTHSSNTADSVNSLTSAEPFTLSAGSLNVATTVEVDNTFTLSGGTLENATVLAGAGGQGITATGGTLDGVTLNSNLMANNFAVLDVEDRADAQRDGEPRGQQYAGTSQLPGQPTLSGNGSVVFGGLSSSYKTGLYVIDASGPATLTIGAGITIHGGQWSGGLRHQRRLRGHWLARRDADESGHHRCRHRRRKHHGQFSRRPEQPRHPGSHQWGSAEHQHFY